MVLAAAASGGRYQESPPDLEPSLSTAGHIRALMGDPVLRASLTRLPVSSAMPMSLAGASRSD